MKSLSMTIVAALVLLATLGCQPSPESGRGFRLPDGNVEVGATAFTGYGCHSCHTVEGEELPEVEPNIEEKVNLGGDTTRIKTYGELVSSVINPTHRLAPGYPLEQITDESGESKMIAYNEVLTVQDLIDLVAYMQSKYQLVIPQFTYHPYVAM